MHPLELERKKNKTRRRARKVILVSLAVGILTGFLWGWGGGLVAAAGTCLFLWPKAPKELLALIKNDWS